VKRINPHTTTVRNEAATSVELRLLETTDIHGHILPFDYLTSQDDTSTGLARTATLIHEARAQAVNTLLFDTGDFLQGSPMTDVTAQPESEWTGGHPAISAMNELGYDAVGLGNHEFNFGIEWLLQTLEQARFPVTCANAVVSAASAPQNDTTLVPQYLLLDRSVVDTDGQPHDIRIGVLGLLPPQITNWDHFHLEGRLTTRAIVETAHALVPKIKAEGADIVIALAHTGIEDSTSDDSSENAALALARVPGLTAILAGHSHLVFPSVDHAGIAGVDIDTGHLHGVPAVMAGSHGSHLGVLDLTLNWTAKDGWTITNSRSEAWPVNPKRGKALAKADTTLCNLLSDAHRATMARMAKPVGHSDTPLHSYLSMVRSDPLVHMIAQAQRDALHLFVPKRDLARWPVLSAASAFRMGGRAGPDHFTDIPPGPLTTRHASDIYAFPNTLCAVILNGAELRDWLERAAAYFNRVVPGEPDQQLINPSFPGHHFDVIDGLSYDIDLSVPSRYEADGRCSGSTERRITNLRHQGQAIDLGQEFIVATNNFRLFGGAPYVQSNATHRIYQSQLRVIDAVKRHLHALQGTPDFSTAWTFRAMPDTSIVFDTGPGLRHYPDDIAAHGLTDIGDTEAGFARFRMRL
jgi:2',3'-cyclic-nucleotide 2'-phosphodiesterase/3'-nucleotidase